ncbi:hypothetical protein ACP70R_034878 [Stipagrostis hirtigluma subsp. patula]
MAELAAGAVSSLLVVIRNEALLLGGVRSDVQFIKEEMESMNSFLAHLARSVPPGGEHDEQVRTWMNQVQLLAQDCNNCIDLYLYRGNSDVQRARGRIRRYLWWVYWFLHKLAAQHQAAIQLRELKERARDVGERRLRYGVEVPARLAVSEQSPRAAGRSSSAQPFAPAAAGGYGAGDDEEDGDDQLMVPTVTISSLCQRRTYSDVEIFRVLEEAEIEREEGDDDERQQSAPIRLHEAQYARILRKVFPEITNSMPLQDQQQGRSTAKQATKITLDEDQVKQMIHEAKQEILRELQEGKHDKNQDTGEGKCDNNRETSQPRTPDQNLEESFKQVNEKMDKIKEEFKEQLKIKWFVDKIKHHLKEKCPLFILKSDKLMDASRWEDTRNALSLLELSADIFTHALYAKPKKSNEDLIKLNNTLHDSPKSFDVIAKKMFKFSYSDLPKEYKSCLLYLAIFPPGHNIKRSTLLGRWVAEGLIFKEDWPSSVSQANRCFDMLINRWLIYPADIGATGKVKSCAVGDIVHGFITKIARKQHIVEPRLSRHLARHFSIFNDLHLRSSEGIQNFFQRLSKSSRVSMLKVLDLEGCHCFGGKNQRYLKEICRKMLLLKYLSLRGTDITQLPSEINHLRELEVLDIRQTKVPENATRHVLLLKLKRLLGSHIDSSLSNSDKGTTIQANKSVSTVQIPQKIGKMANLEVLSNVKAQDSNDLKEIGTLCYLRKLGVVIDNNNSCLRKLIQAISDLHECLLSLSITVTREVTHYGGLHECLGSLSSGQEGTHSSEELSPEIGSHLKNHPNLLESLSIRGKAHLLPLFAKDGNNKLAKVTLSSTSLNQDNLKALTKLPTLQCISLRHIAFTENMRTFEEEEFRYLKYLHVEGSNLTEIIFEGGATPDLEKMVLSFTNIESVSGVECLQKLEELELNNNSNNSRLLSSFDNAEQIAKLTLRGTFLEQGDLQILAKKPNMRCLVLLNMSCEVSQITFNKDEFPKLNILTVDCSSITKIDFTSGSAPKLEKIVWSSRTSLSGINNLLRFKELEVIGGVVHNEVEEAIKGHKNKPHFKHTPGQAIRNTPEAVAAAISLKSLCWKNQV